MLRQPFKVSHSHSKVKRFFDSFFLDRRTAAAAAAVTNFDSHPLAPTKLGKKRVGLFCVWLINFKSPPSELL